MSGGDFVRPKIGGFLSWGLLSGGDFVQGGFCPGLEMLVIMSSDSNGFSAHFPESKEKTYFVLSRFVSKLWKSFKSIQVVVHCQMFLVLRVKTYFMGLEALYKNIL